MPVILRATRTISSQGRNPRLYIQIQDGRWEHWERGLWEHWERGTSPIDSRTILTTDANEVVGSIHDRMPVILRATRTIGSQGRNPRLCALSAKVPALGTVGERGPAGGTADRR
jgi:hypothetical protein